MAKLRHGAHYFLGSVSSRHCNFGCDRGRYNTGTAGSLETRPWGGFRANGTQPKQAQTDTGTAQSIKRPRHWRTEERGATYNGPVTVNPPAKAQTPKKHSDSSSINGNCNNTGPNGSVNATFTIRFHRYKSTNLGNCQPRNPDGTFTSTVLVFVEPHTAGRHCHAVRMLWSVNRQSGPAR